MTLEKKCQQMGCDAGPSKIPFPALCNTTAGSQESFGQEASRGIYRSASRGKVYGYYAQAGLHNLMFCTRIQRDLASTVKDHIILMRMLEQIRSGPGTDFPSRVQSAVASVLQEEGLAECEFLRAVRVSFSAQHWIGRNLFVHRDRLDSALVAWSRFNGVKGQQLFRGSQLSTVYTPERAKEQWKRVREVFVELQLEFGRMNQLQVEERLAVQEARCQVGVERAAARWRRQQWEQKQQQPGRVKDSANKPTAQAALLRRMEQLIWSWDLAVAKRRRQRMRADMQKRKLWWQNWKKRRWDGKEPLIEFERRVRNRTMQKGA